MTRNQSRPIHSVVHWVALSALGLGFIATSSYAETCGIDLIFADGYENITNYPALSSLPQALSSPGTTASIDGATLSVAITYPTAGANLNTPSTQVVGTFSGPTNTGLVINGQIAFTQGGKFLIPDVPLQPGSNTLNLTAAKMTGATTTATLSLTQSGTSSPVSLATERDVGYAPQTIRFLPSVSALPAGASVQSISVDYGDNSSPYSGVTFPEPFYHTYQQPGLYPVLLTVTDTQNNSYITKHWVIIQYVSAQRGMLCDVYGYMRQQLANQQIPAALNALQGPIRNRYQPVFSGLGSNLTAATNSLGVIVTGTLLGDTAQFLVVRERPDHSLAGFPLSFAQSADGVWRITGM